MTFRNLNRSASNRFVYLVLLALGTMAFAVMGCSSGGGSGPSSTGGQTDMDPGVVQGDINPGEVAFEFASEDEDGNVDYMIRGRNIDYAEGCLSVDLSIVVMTDDPVESATLTFLELMPEGVTVKNADNGEMGAGAMMRFEFSDEMPPSSAAASSVGQESLPRRAEFGSAEGQSIAFVSMVTADDNSSDLGAIGGMVWNDENENGEMDEGEEGIEGVMIKLSCDDDDMEPKTATTDAMGLYIFEELESALYTVYKPEQDGVIPTTATEIQVVLVEGDEGVDPFLAANFGCLVEDTGEPTTAIEGVVFKDANGNGMQDDGEMGLEGISIVLEGPDGTSEDTKTDMMGVYRFGELVAGTYEVTKVVPEGYEATTDNPVEVELADSGSGLEGAEVNFGCKEAETYTVLGAVYNDANRNGMRDEGEEGIQDVKVTLMMGGTATSTSTGPEGGYAFADLTEGVYKVVKTVPEGYEATTDEMVDVIVPPTPANGNVLEVNFGCAKEAAPLSSISGVVFNDVNKDGVQDEGESGIEGVTVVLEMGGTKVEATTDADGNYGFENLEKGMYSVQKVEADGWESTSTNPVEVTITEADDFTVDFGCVESGGPEALSRARR